GGGCHDSGGNDVVGFGSIHRSDHGLPVMPVRLHMHKGDLLASGWDPETGRDPHDGFGSWSHSLVATDAGELYWTADELLRGWIGTPSQSLVAAYKAGRSARFEHGES